MQAEPSPIGPGLDGPKDGSGADALAQAAGQQLLRPRALRFADALEARFGADTAAARCRRAQAALLFGLLGFDAFLLADYVLVPDVFGAALLLRLGVVTPLGLVAAWWLGRCPPQQARDAVLAALGVAATVAVAVLCTGSAAPHAAAYQLSAVLPLLFPVLAAAPGFGAAAVGAAIGLLGYAGCLLLAPFPAAVKAGSVAVAACLAGLGLLAGRRAEGAERRAYLLELREALHAEAETEKERALLELSHTDPLTGAANRRLFEVELQAGWDALGGGSVAVLLVDVDHFRRFNDRYGPQAGDRCLAAVAATMQQQLRADIDLLARYGGEEFAIILPGADLGDAAVICERIRRAVEELAIPHEGNPPLRLVTVSIGFAAAERGSGRPEALVDGADAALYAAKQAGRNRIAPPLAVSPDRAVALRAALGGRNRRRGSAA